jgi:NAD(P)-dependent dehydrogenase (short-subunit alcohol dehydrogenase family)
MVYVLPREPCPRPDATMASEKDKTGPKPSPRNPQQTPPGVEGELRPQADHGEQSYQGAGKLQGLAAIVTGGDSGIGRAVAIAFAREGADVAIGYGAPEEEKDALETQSWVEEAGRRCLTHRFDVRDPAACRAFVRAVHDAFGRLDVLVNNAAWQMERESLDEVTDEEIDRTFRTNIFGYLYMAREALRVMPGGGVILNTGSVTAMQGNKGLIPYSATKGAIHTFTMSLAMSVAERGIRVNCVAPGPVWTPLIPATLDADHVKRFGADTVFGRPAQPAELAPLYVFLASNDARYVTGEILAATGRGGTR